MSEMYAFGSLGTTIVFAVVISVAGAVLGGLSLISTRYSLRNVFGIYDPIFKSKRRFASTLNPNMPVYVVHPYAIYEGLTYLMFGNSNITGRRVKVKKLEVLTTSQLNEFFPLSTYKKWLDGGKEEVNELNKDKMGYMETFETDSVIEVVPSNAEGDREKLNEEIEVMETDITEMDRIKHEQSTSTSKLASTEDSSHNAKHFTSGICAICLEDLEDSDNVRGLLCGHVFHDSCIDPWLTKRKGCCPTCKKDLYIEVNKLDNSDNSETQENRDLNPTTQPEVIENYEYHVSNLVTLVDVVPGSPDLDYIFNIHPDNLLAFFVLKIITRVKAQTILLALLYNRSNITNIETIDTGIDDEIISLDITMIDKISYNEYSANVCQYLEQPNDDQSQEKNTPPLPDISKINPLLKRVVEHQPSLFNPADLVDLDHVAWKETKRMRRGLKALFFKALGVSKTDLYYHNVIKIYKTRQHQRLQNRS